jgi:protein-S-isoprenylcysteine O-methyltransferase Ste14
MLRKGRSKVRRIGSQRADFFARLFVFVQVCCALVLLGNDIRATFSSPQWKFLQLLGVIILLPSLILWSIARIQLGRCCTLLPFADQLVTKGLYARLRNPIYLFGSLTIVGYLLFYDRCEGMLCMLVVVPIQYARALKESSTLEKQFGVSYQEYVKRTWI